MPPCMNGSDQHCIECIHLSPLQDTEHEWTAHFSDIPSDSSDPVSATCKSVGPITGPTHDITHESTTNVWPLTSVQVEIVGVNTPNVPKGEVQIIEEPTSSRHFLGANKGKGKRGPKAWQSTPHSIQRKGKGKEQLTSGL